MLNVERASTSAERRLGLNRPAIRDIVVNLSLGDREAATDFAVSVAAEFRAHLTAIAFAYEPAWAPSYTGGLPARYVEAYRAECADAARTAIARFEEAGRRVGVATAGRMISEGLFNAADQFGRFARRFDLSILGQEEPGRGAAEGLIIEAALFESGRPVLIVPYIQRHGLKLDRVMVCWDGSRNAARAIADAMPLLMRAKVVEVVIVTSERPKSDELPGADIAHHLARHNLSVDLKRIVGMMDVAATILSHAADSMADLIVMGAYGHSRLREYVLGGATRGILTSMTVPVLMSH